jgi:hypothetical protein
MLKDIFGKMRISGMLQDETVKLIPGKFKKAIEKTV